MNIFKKRAGIYFFPLFIFLGYSAPLFASFEFGAAQQAVYDEASKMRITNAEKQLNILKQTNPNNTIHIYLSNFIEFNKIIWAEETRQFEAFEENTSSRIDYIGKQNKNSPWFLFTQAELKLQLALVQIKQNEAISAAWNIRAAYVLLTSNAARYPDFIPTYKSLGIIHVIAGSVPDKYHWLLGLVGMKGNVRSGLKELEKAAQTSNPVQLEALISISLINAFLLNNPTLGAEQMGQLFTSNTDNLLVVNLYGILLKGNGNSKLAQKILQNRPKTPEYTQIANVYRLIGDTYLAELQYSSAITWYKYFLNQYHGHNYIKEANSKLMLCYWLENNQVETLKYQKRVLNYGTAHFDADKKANHFATTYQQQNKLLIKARLVCDGGNYVYADKLFDGITISHFTNYNDKLEYYYRRGRICHFMKKMDLAVQFYGKTIEISSLKDYIYFAPNAALQTGYIYQDRKEYDKARFYFKKALSYKSHEYKSNIDQKARIALRDISKEK